MEGSEGAVIIRHTFYEKSVTAPLVFHSKSAHTWRSKLVTLAEEVRRRLRNTDKRHSRTEILIILKTFSQKMIDSGYEVSSRQKILRSGIRKFYREVEQARKEGRSIYRTRDKMNKRSKHC